MSVARAPSSFLVPKLLVARPLAGFAAGLAVTVLAIALLGPGRPAPPPPDSAAEEERGALAQLARALAEAEANCERSERAGAGPFQTAELQRALVENPLLLEQEQGELPALVREARWLSSLAADGAGLGPRRSWEDARFLLGFFRWYLDCARASAAARRGAGGPVRTWPPRRYDPARLVEFRGHDYQSLLGAFD